MVKVGGKYEDGVLRKASLQVKLGSIVMNETCNYVMMDQEGILQETVENTMLRISVTDTVNI